MGSRNASAAVFSARLGAEMVSRRLSRRALGKLIDPDNAERGRRKVLRHLSGKHAPSTVSRVAYARALGLPDNAFFDEDEEDEEMSVPDILRGLARDQQRLAAEIARLARTAVL